MGAAGTTRASSGLRAALGTAGAAVMGAAPHVLHHVGPLAGAAVLAGATGRLLFGALGFVLAIPLLRRMRRRTGSWRIPSALLAAMVAMFSISSFVLGPALAGEDDEDDTPPAGVTPSEHETHHP